MWLLFALLTPLFWSLVHIADSHCVEEIFEKPWMGVITSSLASTVVFLVIPFAAPFIHWELPPPYIICLGLFAGVLIQLSQAFYFNALSYTETGIVAAYWNMTPALIPFLSYLIFRDILGFPEYLGISLLIVASVLMCMLDTNFHARWNSFFLMFSASLFQAFALLIEDKVFQHASYINGFLLITLGLVLAGSAPLLFKNVRKTFSRNAHLLKPAINIFIAIEVLNLFALATSQRAIYLGNPSLVAAVETSVPAYTFLLSLILIFFSSRFGDIETLKHLPVKFGLVGLMVLGVFLVA